MPASPARPDPGKPVLVGESLGLAQQPDGAVDQRHVRESLGEIPDEPAGNGVVLLGEQAEIGPQRQQPLEQFHGVAMATDEVQIVDQPERTGEKRARAPESPSTCSERSESYRLTKPSTVSSRATASIVPTTRESVGGRNPTIGIMSTLASSSVDP